jgi:hypothetical protein
MRRQLERKQVSTAKRWRQIAHHTLGLKVGALVHQALDRRQLVVARRPVQRSAILRAATVDARARTVSGGGACGGSHTMLCRCG